MEHSKNKGTSQINAYFFDLLARMFGYPGGVALDPFCGSFERGIICRDREMNYMGIDIRAEQIAANLTAMKLLGANGITYRQADAAAWLDSNERMFDFVLTCPPYFNLERYSKLEGDLSNKDTSSFLASMQSIVFKAISSLNNNRFAVFVVGNARDKNGEIRQMNHHIIEAAKSAGAVFYNELIYIRPYGTLSFRAPRFYKASRKLGSTHEFALVFYKGNPRTIKRDYVTKTNIKP